MTLVKSFQLVKKILPRSSLTLIGDGSLKQQIMDFVEHSGLFESVFMPGKVAPADMPGHLSQYDIYVNSSVVDNYPISILEAFSSGLPVITTAAGGIPYMVAHEETGLLVTPKDHQALAQEMIRLAGDTDLGKALAVNAKKFADEHSWKNIWPKLNAVYR